MLKVENFNLFGERSDLPDVVHCETIEARSLVHNWEFTPHRHAHLHQFLLIESGGGQAQIEAKNFALHSGMLVNMPVGIVHGFQFRADTHGWVVTLASEILEESLRDNEGLRPLLSQPKVLISTNEIRRVINAIFEEYPTRDFARAHILRALSGLLAGLVARALIAEAPLLTRPAHQLHLRFEALIETNYHQHLRVADYASLLAVTPTHLSRIMRQATGRSASTAIEERVIREARRHLAYSNLLISEIAYQLGFADPAYFSRVFTRATGVSPREFRARVETTDTRPTIV